MEKRIFGCPEFSDIVFNTSLTMMEKILDYVLEDQLEIANGENSGKERVFRIGFYAHEHNRTLDVMVETFEDDMVYQERFKDYFKPDYMRDPIDYYLTHKIRPKVIQY